MSDSVHEFVVEDVFVLKGGLIATCNVPERIWPQFEALAGEMLLSTPDGTSRTVHVQEASLFTHCFGDQRGGGFLLAGDLAPRDVPLKSIIRKA
ncbi:MAG: hypothetical protein EON59_05040 [Alphaproteobacteria bacterium]|nr:MAG: hypothetical protein EON59_05040 [Alphaproteobacteria bacterium]